MRANLIIIPQLCNAAILLTQRDAIANLLSITRIKQRLILAVAFSRVLFLRNAPQTKFLVKLLYHVRIISDRTPFRLRDQKTFSFFSFSFFFLISSLLTRSSWLGLPEDSVVIYNCLTGHDITSFHPGVSYALWPTLFQEQILLSSAFLSPPLMLLVIV